MAEGARIYQRARLVVNASLAPRTSAPRTSAQRPRSGAPGGSRTPDQRLRRPLLYPSELRALRLLRVSKGARTLNPRIHSPVLYRLSYTHRKSKLARPEGIEPPTCGFEGRRSIHLSYGR